MKLFKSLLLVAAIAGLFTSCSDEGYWDAYNTKSTTTYSFMQQSNNFNLGATDTLPDIKVTVNRNTNRGNVTLPLNVQFNSNIMSVDSANIMPKDTANITSQDNVVVIFNEGEYTADLIINVDKARIQKGFNYEAQVSFLVDSLNFFEHNYSISGNKSFTLKFVQNYTWVSIGKCLYTDDVVDAPGFGLPQIVTYEVETEQAVENHSIIRLKNAYGAIYPYNAPGDYDTNKNYYITINAEDPEGVYIDGWCEMGMDWGYGMFSVTSYGYYMMAAGYDFEAVKAAGYMGTLDEDLCITFPVKGLVMQMADWGMTYANKNGACKIDLSTTELLE